MLFALPIAIATTGPAAADTAPSAKVSDGHPAPIAVVDRGRTVPPALAAFIDAAAVVPFVDGAIDQVSTAPGRVTDIALQAGETLISVASGDTARWVIGDTTSGSGADKRAHVLIKPVAAGLTTNLVITTDRRTYHVALSSRAGPAMSSLSWIYPQDALIALKRSEAAAAAAAPVAAGLDVDQLHFNYVLSGD